MKAAKVERIQKLLDVDSQPTSAGMTCAPSAARHGLRLRCAAAGRRSRHRRGRHGLRAHGARPRPRGLRHLDGQGAGAAEARHRHHHPLHRRRRRALHQGCAGLRGQARHRRQGQQGRRQPGGHRCADEGQRADRARPAQAPVSAFLALQEAGDLPQHAAVVHRHGQAAAHAGAPAATRPCARPRSRPSPRPSSCRPRDRTGCAA